MRKTAHVDTSADAVDSFAALGEVWSAVKGGDVGDLAKGFHIRGVSGGAHASAHLSTKLRWNGANDSVMIDMPAPVRYAWFPSLLHPPH